MTAGEIALTIFSKSERAEARLFESLMAAHERLVLRTAYRLLGRMEDAQDATQEVFLRLFRNLSQIDGDPKAWLYRVTVNVCNDHHRRRRQTCELVHGVDERRADPAPNPERALTIEERKRLVMDGLATLPQRERASVVLRDIEGLSTAEVAAILGVEVGTVRSHISTGRVKLTKYVRSRQ